MDTPPRAEQPQDGDERTIVLAWLAFHRDALTVKCRGLTDDQLAARSAPPSAMSLLGIVRHLAAMERAYGAWALGSAPEPPWVWGPYEHGHEPDFACDASMAAESWP